VRAIIQERYGSPDTLKLADIEKPVANDDQVLVRVRAASLNSGDWRRVRGAPFLVRTDSGLLKPQAQGVATDAAGEVESAGKDVTDVKPGDRVYGVRLGSCGEYVAGRNFAPMPANLTFEQAAAIPVAGCTALQAARDHGGVQPGQRVLINGAGGGVGTFLVQIAKAFGAEVTAVTSTDKVDMLGSIGADHVVDYTREDFAKTTERYDVVFDIGGNRSIGASLAILAPGGNVVQIGVGKGQVGPLLRLLNGVIRMRLLKQPLVVFIANVNKDDLGVLRDMAESGKLMPVIDRTYPLAETAAAFHRLETTHATGKIVITI
jgi:NADPH:quinone reductase-like Zn-dependent oxidoreductase